MKKGAPFVLLFAALFISLSFVSAIAPGAGVTPADVQAATVKGAGLFGGFLQGIVQGVFVPLFGAEAILPRLLLFFLLYLLVYSIVPAIFGEKYWLNVGVSLVISILGIMTIPPNFIQAIATQYGIMGAVLLAVIPFVIVLLFSARVKSALVARLVWVAYVIFYFAIYGYLWWTTVYGWSDPNLLPYLGAIIFGIIAFFFMPQVRHLLFKGDMSGIKEAGDEIVGRAKLLHKLQREELEGYKDQGSGV